MDIERLARLERAVGQLGEALFGININRQPRELRELVAEWQQTLAESAPPRPVATSPAPGRYLPVYNHTMDMELREAAGDVG